MVFRRRGSYPAATMWTPPERIRHRVEPTHWPSAEQAAASRLFSPIELGPTRLATRTWVPAMVPWRADDEGFVTPDVIDWYRRFAQGRPGALVVEATGVRDVPSGPLLRIGDDRFVPGLRGLVDAVREASEGETKLLIQCIDFLAVKRRPPADKFFARFLRLGPAHRERMVAARGEVWAQASEEQLRAALLAGDDALHEALLSQRELRELRLRLLVERHTHRPRLHQRALARVQNLVVGARGHRRSPCSKSRLSKGRARRRTGRETGRGAGRPRGSCTPGYPPV